MEFLTPKGGLSRVQYLASVLAGMDAADPQGTAQLVLERFGSLAAFAGADRTQLTSALAAIPGLSSALIAAQEITFAALRERVVTSRLDPGNPAFLDYLRLRIGDRHSEILLGFFASANGSLLCERTLAESEGHALTISAAAILRAAIAVSAGQIVLVHNHPSGIARPSQADKVATRALTDRAAALDIVVLDHLIVGNEGVYSMQRRRLL